MLKHLKLDKIRVRRNFNALDVALVFKLRSKGATHTDISKIIGCSRVYVGYILRGERRLGDTMAIDAQIELAQLTGGNSNRKNNHESF